MYFKKENDKMTIKELETIEKILDRHVYSGKANVILSEIAKELNIKMDASRPGYKTKGV